MTASLRNDEEQVSIPLTCAASPIIIACPSGASERRAHAPLSSMKKCDRYVRTAKSHAPDGPADPAGKMIERRHRVTHPAHQQAYRPHAAPRGSRVDLIGYCGAMMWIFTSLSRSLSAWVAVHAGVARFDLQQTYGIGHEVLPPGSAAHLESSAAHAPAFPLIRARRIARTFATWTWCRRATDARFEGSRAAAAILQHADAFGSIRNFLQPLADVCVITLGVLLPPFRSRPLQRSAPRTASPLDRPVSRGSPWPRTSAPRIAALPRAHDRRPSRWIQAA
jgi:hypothetical protein